MHGSLPQLRRHRYRPHAAAVLVLFAVQALVPAGYMPASAATGWLLKLCPVGLSPEALAVLHPTGHGDHHAGHGDATSPATPDTESWQVGCPFAASAAGAWAPVSGAAAAILDARPGAASVAPDRALACDNRYCPHPARAPPVDTHA